MASTDSSRGRTSRENSTPAARAASNRDWLPSACLEVNSFRTPPGLGPLRCLCLDISRRFYLICLGAAFWGAHGLPGSARGSVDANAGMPLAQTSHQGRGVREVFPNAAQGHRQGSASLPTDPTAFPPLRCPMRVEGGGHDLWCGRFHGLEQQLQGLPDERFVRADDQQDGGTGLAHEDGLLWCHPFPSRLAHSL